MATIERTRVQTPEKGKIHKKISLRKYVRVASAYLREPHIPVPLQPLNMEAMLTRETILLDHINVRIDPGNFSDKFEQLHGPAIFVNWINSSQTNLAELLDAEVNLHTVPSTGPEYDYDGWSYKWDEDVIAATNARRGKPRQAALALLSAENYRDPQTGFLSNKSRIKHVEKGDAIFLAPERRLYNHSDFSGYTQPPLKSWAAWETYQSFINQGNLHEGRQFLEAIYGTTAEQNYTGLLGENAYFIKHRQNSNEGDTDPLIFTIHANETGRDYDPALGPHIKTLPGHGRITGLANAAIVWMHFNGLPILKEKSDRFKGFNQTVAALGQDRDGRRDWIPERVRKFYAVNDVMFNALHVMNLRYTADVAEELGRDQDVIKYRKLATSVSEKIIERMWDIETGFFYNLDKDGNQIPVTSITGLFPLLFDNLPINMAEALLSKLKDKEWFGTEFPIPSHPTNSPHYDPHYFRKEGADWKGPVWINMNHLLVEEGLVTQARRFLDPNSSEYNHALGMEFLEIAEHIEKKTYELLASNELVYEQNDPEGRPKTIFKRAIRPGKGQRVENFSWPNIGLHFDRLNMLKKDLGLAA